MKTPVRYDGHACDHEILHRMIYNDMNYMSNLKYALKETDIIIFDVNLYTIYNAYSHFQILREEYPNIKNIVLTADSKSWNSIVYSDRFDMFCPEHLIHPTMDYHKFTVTFDWTRFHKKTTMTFCDYYKNLKFLKGLYWCGNDIDIYMSDKFKILDSSYSHWYKSLSQYHPLSPEEWDQIIINNYKLDNFMLYVEDESKF